MNESIAKLLEVQTHICEEHNLMMIETRTYDEKDSMLDTRLEVMDLSCLGKDVSDEKLKEEYGMKLDVWDFEWEVISSTKKEINKEKYNEFLYEHLKIRFMDEKIVGEIKSFKDLYETDWEFNLEGVVLPMMFIKKIGHYNDDEELVADAYVDVEWARVEVSENGSINVWIFEPSKDCGGEFLRDAEIKHYDKNELEKEIIKQWKKHFGIDFKIKNKRSVYNG